MYPIPFMLYDPETDRPIAAHSLLYRLGVQHADDIPALLAISEYLSYLELELMLKSPVLREPVMPARIKRLRRGASFITVIILAALLGSLLAEVIASFIHSTLPMFGQIVAMIFLVVIVAIAIAWIIERRKLLKGDKTDGTY